MVCHVSDRPWSVKCQMALVGHLPEQAWSVNCLISHGVSHVMIGHGLSHV